MRQLAYDSADSYLCVLYVAVNRENRTADRRKLLEVRDDRVRTTYHILTELGGRRYHVDLTLTVEARHGQTRKRTDLAQLCVTLIYDLSHLQEVLAGCLNVRRADASYDRGAG